MTTSPSLDHQGTGGIIGSGSGSVIGSGSGSGSGVVGDSPSRRKMDPSITNEDIEVSLREDLPPLRMNASRVPERLSSSGSNLLLNSFQSTRRRSLPIDLSKSRSRSRSPSLRETTDGNSSVSSLEDFNDILTDRMGLEELEPSQKSNTDMHISVSSLPPVTERLSEDTLEDVHAFSDLSHKCCSASRANSIANSADIGLDTLEECADEDHEEVHISNIERLTIHEDKTYDAEGASELAEASVPTTRT